MPGLRRHVAFSAGIALAFGLGGCVHLANGMVPQAATDATGIVVFDVDGTLTPTVPKIFWARPDAAAVARLYAERGHRIVYLTARSPLLQGTLQKFLTRNAFCQPGVWSVCLTGWEMHRQNLLRAQSGSPGQVAEGRQSAH